jgi:hypothetical protein
LPLPGLTAFWWQLLLKQASDWISFVLAAAVTVFSPQPARMSVSANSNSGAAINLKTIFDPP